jgi:hypothetical protein
MANTWIGLIYQISSLITGLSYIIISIGLACILAIRWRAMYKRKATIAFVFILSFFFGATSRIDSVFTTTNDPWLAFLTSVASILAIYLCFEFLNPTFYKWAIAIRYHSEWEILEKELRQLYAEKEESNLRFRERTKQQQDDDLKKITVMRQIVGEPLEDGTFPIGKDTVELAKLATILRNWTNGK